MTGNKTGKLKKLRYLTSIIIIMAVPLLGAPFKDNGDGTVTDKGTGLIWQKCNVGETYSGGTCSGAATNPSWAIALTTCNTLTLAGKPAGFWRLPNITELISIVDFNRVPDPYAIDPTFFSVVTGFLNDIYWSSTTDQGTPANVFYYAFSVGTNGVITKTTNLKVRCVAGP